MNTDPRAGIILIHGGPGAPGSLRSLANELGKHSQLVEQVEERQNKSL